MNQDFSEAIEEVKKRIASGASLQMLLEEYSNKYKLEEAFYIITQAQIQKK